MTPVGNSDLQEEMENTGKSKCVGWHKRLFFLLFKKAADYLKQTYSSILWVYNFYSYKKYDKKGPAGKTTSVARALDSALLVRVIVWRTQQCNWNLPLWLCNFYRCTRPSSERAGPSARWMLPSELSVPPFQGVTWEQFLGRGGCFLRGRAFRCSNS